MMTPKVFALYSPAMQSGKGEVASFLNHRFNSQTIKLAGPVKNMLLSFLTAVGIDSSTALRMMDGDLKEDIIDGFTFSPRDAMQTLGTDWRDTLQTNMWVVIALRKVAEVLSKGRSVVIDDLRFPHEYDALRERDDACLVKVYRPDAVPLNDHPSEGLLNDRVFDVVISNDGTLGDLTAQLERTFGAISSY